MSDPRSGLRTRRSVLRAAAAAPLATAIPAFAAQAAPPIRRRIPRTGEELAVMGLGTFRVFDVGEDAARRAELSRVMPAFFREGGQLIDSSPMYGPAEQVTGQLLAEIEPAARAGLFAATKVWIDGRDAGIEQMNASFEKMGVQVMDLMQIHNLRDWRSHLPVLRDWQAQGRIRYVGITTSSGRSHAELAELLRRESFDFVQFTYSVENRGVEQDLLPIARERGIAVLVNRPFEAGGLFQRIRDRPLPGWAAEIECHSWAQAMLKFVVSHPDVTCAIPATGKLDHLLENMAAGRGPLPDAALRERMVRDILAA